MLLLKSVSVQCYGHYFHIAALKVWFKDVSEFSLNRVYLDLQWSEHIVSAPHFEAGFASFKMRGGNDMLRPLWIELDAV